MMLNEFEQHTGFYPTLAQYAAIERAYTEFGGDKDAFCEAYKKNTDGIAERIQSEAHRDAIKLEEKQAADLTRRDAEIDRLGAEIERLKKQLDRELEWKPYGCQCSSHLLTDWPAPEVTRAIGMVMKMEKVTLHYFHIAHAATPFFTGSFGLPFLSRLLPFFSQSSQVSRNSL